MQVEVTAYRSSVFFWDTVYFQNTICLCLAYWMIHSAAWRYWRVNDPSGNDAVATGAVKIANAFECPDNPQKLPLPLGGSAPYVIHVLWAHPSLHPKRHVDRFSRVHMGPKYYAVQCAVNGEENPRNCPSAWDFVFQPKKDRATAIGNMHKKCGKDRACGSGDMLMDTQMRSLQYFATAPAGEVIRQI